jgi:pSer/pThr/pTyr-binding forkhead associated (FHA) protein
MDYRITVEPAEDRKSKPGETIAAPKSFPPGIEQVTLGRDPTSDIVFPQASQRIVSRKHGRIYRQASGDYAIEPFGDRYIEVDGYPADRGQPLKDGALIRLGDKDGPLLRVRLEESAGADTGPVTIQRKGQESTGKKLAVNRRYMLAGLAALVVLAAAVAWMFLRVPSLEAKLAALRERTTALAAADFSGDTDALRNTAYLVVLRDREGLETPAGTAWPYAPGLLVTNAHVAVLFDRLTRGQTLVVRPPGGEGEDHLVTGNRLHPGYLAFREFLGEAETASTGFSNMTADIPWPSAYDVGVLEVDNGDALPPGLPIVETPGADDVEPGTSLAFAGYPVEGAAAERTAQIAPNPQLQFGAVTSLSDYFLFAGDDADGLLVQNSLPAAGGASGSAVINSDGFVVAVLSGGTVVATDEGRTPSAVLLNYAQRADLIPAALDPSLFDLEAARAEWEAALARFDEHEMTMVEAVKGELSEATGAEVGEADLIVPASLAGAGAVRAGTTQYRVHEVEVEAGRTYSFFAYGDTDGSISLTLFRGEEGIGGAGGGRWFAGTTFTADRDETLQVRILGPASDPVDYKLYVFSVDGAGAPVASSAGGG